jgi:P-type Ca2+ transporter type 2C
MQAYACSAESVLEKLRSDPELGLTEQVAAERLRAEGPNRLSRARRPPYLAIAVDQVADPLVLLLVAAAAVSFAIGDTLEAAAIAAIVVLDLALGFVQEARAARAVIALRERLDRKATVVRGGNQHEVPVEHVVPGDLIVLREGERVAADARVLQTEGLEVDESLLTGESYPVRKGAEAVPEGTELADRTSAVFAGSAVTRGRATAVATATGDGTEMGRVVRLANEAEPPPTPLQSRLQGLARIMVAVGIAVTLVLATGMLLRGEPLHEAFLVGVAVAIAAVPEGLAATVTIALSLGARAMASRGAIVKRLSAVETLGAATVIASDKTGTLTENQLRVAAVRPAPGLSETDVLAAALLASSADVVEEEGGRRILGDPVDGAIVLAALDAGVVRSELLKSRTLVHEIPFEPELRRSAAVYSEEGRRRGVVKGAPEVVLGSPEERSEPLLGFVDGWASEGMRVLAVADCTVGEEALGNDSEWDLQALGLVALSDPVRPQAAEAVAAARAAGLRVQIITGDHPATAGAIARALDLPADDVHARVTPADKLEIVQELQQTNEVVAVTGDGVNDSPALRRADVGIAMGRSGTEAAREAADLVLTDDDFATIVAAIREGRAIGDNIRKFVAFLLSANFGEVLLFAVTILGGLGVPMTVVQVLVVNVLTDGLPAAALSGDPPSAGTMERGPIRSGTLFSNRLWIALGLVGAVVGLAGLGAYLIGRELGAGQAQTMAFATIALAELLLVFSCRSERAPAWRGPWNPWLVASVLISLLLLLGAVYLPFLHEPLGTVSLGGPGAAVVLGFALLPALAAEIAKTYVRRRGIR